MQTTLKKLVAKTEGVEFTAALLDEISKELNNENTWTLGREHHIVVTKVALVVFDLAGIGIQVQVKFEYLET